MTEVPLKSEFAARSGFVDCRSCKESDVIGLLDSPVVFTSLCKDYPGDGKILQSLTIGKLKARPSPSGASEGQDDAGDRRVGRVRRRSEARHGGRTSSRHGVVSTVSTQGIENGLESRGDATRIRAGSRRGCGGGGKGKRMRSGGRFQFAIEGSGDVGHGPHVRDFVEIDGDLVAVLHQHDDADEVQ